MTYVRIEVGMTDGFRYLGIQPPLTKEQSEWLKAADFSDSKIIQSYVVMEPDNGEPYSEAGISTGTDLSFAESHRNIVEAANNIARILVIAGDTVHIDEELHSIGFGRHLFGGYADRLG